jgi:hypothetical protein
MQQEPMSSVNPHAARAAAATVAPSSAASASSASSSAKPNAALRAAAAIGSTAFTAVPTEMPPFVPLSRVHLGSHTPRLAKHHTHGYLIYHSPMERAVKAVKAFSLTSAAMALLSAPVMLVLANPDMPMIGRFAIAGTGQSSGQGGNCNAGASRAGCARILQDSRAD